MICKPCKTGGELNARGLGLIADDKKRDAEAAFQQAEFFHDDCRGCDCQHTVRVKML